MAFLTVGGETVPVEIGSPDEREEPVGTIEPAFSGAPRSTVRGYFRIRSFRTRWISRADAETLIAALKGTPPLTVTGDLMGSVSCLAENIKVAESGRAIIGSVSTEVVRVGFDLRLDA